MTIRTCGAMLSPLSGNVSCKSSGERTAFHWCKHYQGSFTSCFFAFECDDESNQIIGVS